MILIIRKETTNLSLKIGISNLVNVEVLASMFAPKEIVEFELDNPRRSRVAVLLIRTESMTFLIFSHTSPIKKMVLVQ